MSEHTPGPWSYDLDENEIHSDTMQETGGDPAHICEMLGANREANARLIAEAPMMLAMLKEIAAYWGDRIASNSRGSLLRIIDRAEDIRNVPQPCPECSTDKLDVIHVDLACSEAQDDTDPTRWCNACGALTREKCHCGPIAENE